MKTLKILISLFLVLLCYSSFSLAQEQDYKIVQDFKAEYQQIQNDIKNADSLAQLDQIELRMNKLQSTYSSHEALLDKSLYPDDFSSSFEKLRKELGVRRGDFTQITTLSTQVSELSQQIDDLNKKNLSLLAQVKDLTEESKIDKDKIKQLQRSVYALRSSMRKRDELVMEMLDSLLPADYVKNENLTNQEKQKVYSEAQKKDIVENVNKAIEENIRFLQITTLSPDDIRAIRSKEVQFENTWKSFGPKLIQIYSERKKSVKEAQKIDSAFDNWRKSINMEAWNSISEDFANYGINLTKFSNGREFTGVIKNYTQDEIKNTKAKGEKSAKDYTVFADTAWFGNIKPTWVPYLLDNNMLTVAQKDTIEAGISRWKDAAYPGSFSWLYIVIGALAVIIIMIIIRKGSNKKTGPMDSGEAKP